MLRRNLVFTALLPLAGLIGCGSPDVSDVDVEDQAAAAQALIDGGDTLEGTPGDAADAPDEEASLAEAEPMADCGLGTLRRRVIGRYDADGDGTLSPAEREELRSDVEGHPLAQRWVERHRQVRRIVLQRLRFVYDADNSGQLDEAERAALRSDLVARCEARKAQILDRYDVDSSGTLDESERAAFAADVRARITERREQIMARFDVDQSGTLDESERAALREDVIARIAHHRAALLERFDVNGNRRLEDDERAALRDFLRARIRLEVHADEETSI